MDRAEQLKSRRDLLLGPVGLNDSAHDGNVDVLSADVVSGRNHRNVDIW